MNTFETEYNDFGCISKALCQLLENKNLQASIIRNVPIQQAIQAYGNLEQYSYDILLNLKDNGTFVINSSVPRSFDDRKSVINSCTSADIVFLHIKYRRVLMNDNFMNYNLNGKSFQDIISELDNVIANNH